MIDAYLLRYFLAVVEEGGFSRAAERCNVTQPTLSAGIRKLEDHLGTSLFLRSARRVELTPAGSRFLGRAQTIIREYNHALRDMEGLEDGGPKKPLRLGLSHTIAGWMVTLIVKAVQNARPDQRVELSEGTRQELGNKLAQDRLDMAIQVSTGNEPAGDVLFTEGYSLALSTGHPLAKRSVIAAEDLAQDTMIARRRCEVLQATSLHFTSRNVRPPIGLRTTQCDRAMAFVGAGFGVTVAPMSFKARAVVRIALKDFSPTRTIGVHGADQSLVKALRDTLRSAAHQMHTT
ncbi:MAG: LysR family transcriptional regulator [Pseudomonadota bacterium]